MSMKILFRVDGDEQIGAGHVLRSLALAEQFTEQGTPVDFVCRRLFRPGWRRKSEPRAGQSFGIAGDANADNDGRQLLRIALAQNAAWIVLDGYEFSAEYRRSVYQSGRQLLVVDDSGRDDFYHADILVNSMPDAAEITYRHPAGTAIVLLGPHCVVHDGP